MAAPLARWCRIEKDGPLGQEHLGPGMRVGLPDQHGGGRTGLAQL